jgi:hypothetical protein
LGFAVKLADRLGTFGGLVAVELLNRPLNRAWRGLWGLGFGGSAAGSDEQQQWKGGSCDVHKAEYGDAVPRA